MKARINSFQSMGAVDGPGIRFVTFLQGCPLRCLYCHNPDARSLEAGKTMTAGEVVADILTYRPFIARGGVTLSGGEPLAQPHFTLALLLALKKEGIHTVLDTSGTAVFSASERAHDDDRRVLTEILAATDLVLLDIKSSSAAGFQALTGCSMAGLEQFLELANERQQTIWIRQVIVPGLNDTAEDVAEFGQFLQRYPQLQIEKIELLPYHTLGVSKYGQLGIPYPLPGVGALPADKLAELQHVVDQWIRTGNG